MLQCVLVCESFVPFSWLSNTPPCSQDPPPLDPLLASSVHISFLSMADCSQTPQLFGSLLFRVPTEQCCRITVCPHEAASALAAPESGLRAEAPKNPGAVEKGGQCTTGHLSTAYQETSSQGQPALGSCGWQEAGRTIGSNFLSRGIRARHDSGAGPVTEGLILVESDSGLRWLQELFGGPWSRQNRVLEVQGP